MKTRNIIILITVLATLLMGNILPAQSAERDMTTNVRPEKFEPVRVNAHFVFYKDNDRRNRKQAMAIFKEWLRVNGVRSVVKKPRVSSIKVTDKVLSMTFTFKASYGQWEKMTLETTDFEVTMRHPKRVQLKGKGYIDEKGETQYKVK